MKLTRPLVPVLSAMLLLVPYAAAQRTSRSSHSLTDVFKESVLDERFEWHAVGQFPSGPWRDIRALTRPRNQPDPSSTVVITTGPGGHTTRALQFANAIASSCGAYRPIAPTRTYRVSARVRLDQWTDGTALQEWPYAIGPFTRNGNQDFNGGPQVIIYVSGRDRDWRFYSLRSNGGPGNFVSFGAPAELGTWYETTLEFDEDTGQARALITNAASGALLVDQTLTIPFWSPATSGGFENVGVFDGEYMSDATVAGQATVDNLSFSPFL